MVVTVGLTTMDGPDPTGVPPQLPLYQYQSASEPNVPPVIPRVVDPPGQKLLLLVVAAAGSTDEVFTIIEVEQLAVLPQTSFTVH